MNDPLKGTDEGDTPVPVNGPTHASLAARRPKFVPTDVRCGPDQGALSYGQ